MVSGITQNEWTLTQIKDCFKNLTRKVKNDVAEVRKETKKKVEVLRQRILVEKS